MSRRIRPARDVDRSIVSVRASLSVKRRIRTLANPLVPSSRRPQAALTSTTGAAAMSWPEVLMPLPPSRHALLPLTPPHCLTLLLALPLSPATSLLLLDWYASSCPALLLSSLPLRPTLATADTDRARGLLDSLPPCSVSPSWCRSSAPCPPGAPSTCSTKWSSHLAGYGAHPGHPARVDGRLNRRHGGAQCQL